MIPSRYVRSGFGRIAINPFYSFDRREGTINDRDESFKLEQIRMVPLRWGIVDTFLAAAPVTARTVNIAVHRADVTQQIVGVRINTKFASLQHLLSIGAAVTYQQAATVLGNNDGEGTSLVEKVQDPDDGLTLDLKEDFPYSINGPTGKYLATGEKLYVQVFYELATVPGFISNVHLDGGVQFYFLPSERQRQQLQ